MIKAKAGNNIILGIDRENVNRLEEGKPILVNGADLGIEINIIVAFGETLDDVARELNLPRVN